VHDETRAERLRIGVDEGVELRKEREPDVVRAQDKVVCLLYAWMIVCTRPLGVGTRTGPVPSASAEVD
jgi:hypothetical protein